MVFAELFVVFFASGLIAAAELYTVALEGQPAPGAGSGVLFDRFGYPPRPSGAGQLAFVATLTGPGVDESNRQGVWLETSPGHSILLARTGEHAPGTPFGVDFLFFGPPVVNASGDVAITAFLTGPGVDEMNNEGLWLGPPGALSRKMRTGSQAPGFPPGMLFDAIGGNGIALNDRGEFAFVAGVKGTGDEIATLWRGRADSLQLVARSGDQAPGCPAGQVFSEFLPFGPPVIDPQGHVAFEEFLSGGGEGVNDDNATGVWSDSGGSLALVAREGDEAPGMGPGVFLSDIDHMDMAAMLDIDADGRVAFRAALRGSNAQGRIPSGVFIETDSGLQVVAATGQAAPGVPGAWFTSIGTGTSRHGERIAFLAALEGPGIGSFDNEGIWIGTPGDVHLVARAGREAPGTPPGYIFRYFRRPVLGEDGFIAFSTQVGLGWEGGGVDGLWSWDPSLPGDGLTVLVRGGMEIEVTPGDRRTLVVPTNSSDGTGEDGRRGTGRDGRVPFFGAFSNNTGGLFVAAARRITAGGLQTPGDCNQDGHLDISDAVCLFGVLFIGQPARLPCGSGLPSDDGNVALMDWQPDGAADISDGIALLQFLFAGGPRHPLAQPSPNGTGCVAIPDCPSSTECSTQ